MRLLPRTPRGTWLLAGVVWLAVCALLWELLPVRPRAEWVDSKPFVVGFAPSHPTFVNYSARWIEPNIFFQDGADILCGPLRFWEADSGRVVEWFDSDEAIDKVAVSPNGAWIAVRHGRLASLQIQTLGLQLIDTATGKVRFDLPLQDGIGVHLEELVFSPDSRWLAYSAITPDRCVHVYDIVAGREHYVLRLADGRLGDGLSDFAPNSRLAIAPDGRTLAIAVATGADAKDDRHIQLWDLDTGRMTRKLSTPKSEFVHLQFSPDGRHLVAEFNQVWCWDVASGAERFHVDGGIAAVTDRLWLSVKSPGRPGWSLEVWDYARGREYVSNGDGRLAPDARTLAVNSEAPHPIRDWVIARRLPWPFPKQVEEWTRFVDVRTGQEIGRLPPRPLEYASGFSADGRLYAVTDEYGLRIWDVPPRKSLAWFLPLASLSALPVAWLAQRRVRKLRTVT